MMGIVRILLLCCFVVAASARPEYLACNRLISRSGASCNGQDVTTCSSLMSNSVQDQNFVTVPTCALPGQQVQFNLPGDVAIFHADKGSASSQGFSDDCPGSSIIFRNVNGISDVTWTAPNENTTADIVFLRASKFGTVRRQNLLSLEVSSTCDPQLLGSPASTETPFHLLTAAAILAVVFWN